MNRNKAHNCSGKSGKLWEMKQQDEAMWLRPVDRKKGFGRIVAAAARPAFDPAFSAPVVYLLLP